MKEHLKKLMEDVYEGLKKMGYKSGGGGHTLKMIDDPEGNTVKIHPQAMGGEFLIIRYSSHSTDGEPKDNSFEQNLTDAAKEVATWPKWTKSVLKTTDFSKEGKKKCQ